MKRAATDLIERTAIDEDVDLHIRLFPRISLALVIPKAFLPLVQNVAELFGEYKEARVEGQVTGEGFVLPLDADIWRPFRQHITLTPEQWARYPVDGGSDGIGHWGEELVAELYSDDQLKLDPYLNRTATRLIQDRSRQFDGVDLTLGRFCRCQVKVEMHAKNTFWQTKERRLK